ncbi:MAG: hypothetical protein K1V98_02320 [Prevotella sp.]
MKETTLKKALTLKTLTKNNVWDLQENDIFRMMDGADKDSDIKDFIRRYVDMIRSAFMIEELKDDSAIIKGKYEKQGYKIGNVRTDDGTKVVWAVKKRPIVRVTDLTYENIHHISAAKLIEVLERNFGGGWDSLSQSIQDIIESGFDISTTTLPKDRLHKPGGMYEKKVADGYEVLEVVKGTWVEAIFAKVKPETEKPRLKLQTRDEDEIPEDTYNKPEEDDEPDEPTEFDDENITEDNYRTTFEISSDSDEEAENISDFDGDE